MTIASEIDRLQCAKADICTAIENKGVTVGNITLDNYACCIDDISTGVSITPNVEALIVGGGGGGGKYTNGGGGGGGGAVKHLPSQTVTVGNSYSIVVGAGGGSNLPGCNSSAFGTTAGGGGNGRGSGSCTGVASNGGSGGGGAYNDKGATGKFKGGDGCFCLTMGGGGGGGGGAGGDGTPAFYGCVYIDFGNSGNYFGGNGGPAVSSDITGSEYRYSAGGGGGTSSNCSVCMQGCGFPVSKGGTGGGSGALGTGCGCNATNYGAGGGGSVGSGSSYCGGCGKQGIVVIRYKTDGSMGITCATGGSVSYWGGYTIHTFTSNGTFKVIN